MSINKKNDFNFNFRIWSKNYKGKFAYSDVYHFTNSELEQSNWLQGRIQSVVRSNEEFLNWIVFVSETIDDFYRFSIVDRWYYFGPSNFSRVPANVFVQIDGKDYEVANNDSNLNKIIKLLKGKGDMRDSFELFEAEYKNDFQVLPFSYFFLHRGSILSGEDFIELNYPKGFDFENWEESERGWEIVE
jgi:hypothetical protein